MTVPDYRHVVLARAASFGALTSKERCGQFIEAVVADLFALDDNFGHLRKFGAQTQYNGHAVDAVLYKATGQAIDLITASKLASPQTPAQPAWSVETEAHYTDADRYWLAPSALPSGDEEDDVTPPPTKPETPLPPPAPPGLSDGALIGLAAEVGGILDVPGSNYVCHLRGTAEVVMHYAVQMLRHGWTADQVRDDARERARG